MTLREFLARNGGELLGLTLEHLFLVLVSTGIAILIGVPLGILLTRKPGLSKPVLGLRQHHADRAEPGVVRLFDPAQYLFVQCQNRRRHRRANGDRRAGALFAAADHSQHFHRHQSASIRRFATPAAAWV